MSDEQNESGTKAHPVDTLVILPCPFCGENASLGQSLKDKGYYFVNCGSCCASTDQLSGWQYTAEEAIANWNKRI